MVSKSLKFKVGQVLMRIPSWQHDNGVAADIFTPGTILQITKITKKKYFYTYLHFPHKDISLRGIRRGNAEFQEIEETCVGGVGTNVLELAKVLYEMSPL